MPNAPVRDIIMYYEEAGSGDPLILIGGLGADLQAWYFQVPALAKSARVITLDNRGAGRSSAPDRPYTISGMAADVSALMDRLGLSRANVLGWSMGGYIAQELALAEPARVQKLILLATAPSVDGFGRTVVRGMVDIRRSSMSREQQVRLNAPWLYSPALLDDEERFRRSVVNSLNNPYVQQDHAFIRQCEAILAWDPGDAASKITQPALVVYGQDDILVPRRNSEKLAKLIPDATLVEMPGGHAGCMEHSREYNEAFLEFLGAAVAAR